MSDSPALEPSETVEITDQSCYCSVCSVFFFGPLDKQTFLHSLFSTIFFCPWQTNTQRKSQWDLWDRTGVHELERSKEKVRGRKNRKSRTYAKEKREIESEGGRESNWLRLHVVICQRWQGWEEQTCISLVPLVSFHGNAISHPYTYIVCSSYLRCIPSSQHVVQMDCMKRKSTNNVLHVDLKQWNTGTVFRPWRSEATAHSLPRVWG